MKIIITGLLCFGVWTTATTYWYLCKIENMCLDERSNKDLAVNIPNEKVEEENSEITKSENVQENSETEESTPPASTVTEEKEEAAVEETKDISKFYGKSLIYYFAFNTDNISQDLKPDVDFAELVEHLKDNEAIKVTITGHTDNIGQEDSNFKLGLNRAQNVSKMLQQKGVNVSRITTQSKGESTPIASNDSDAGRAKNRRIEIILQN